MPSEVSELIEELIRPSPEEVFGPEPEPTEEEMEKMRAWYFERDREYDAEHYGKEAECHES